jgi:hypothetical protein
MNVQPIDRGELHTLRLISDAMMTPRRMRSTGIASGIRVLPRGRWRFAAAFGNEEQTIFASIEE